MRQQITKDLYSYWNGLRGGRAAPDRADINPGAIPHILADTFIIEVDNDSAFPVRLSGSRINAIWMAEQKGASFVELWREEDRRSISAALLTVVDGVTPVVAGVKIYAHDHAPLELELLLLPLRHFGKTHSRVLGALSPVYQPEWLGQIPAGPLELVSLRIINAPSHSSVASRQPLQGSKALGQRPRLVVYEGDKL